MRLLPSSWTIAYNLNRLCHTWQPLLHDYINHNYKWWSFSRQHLWPGRAQLICIVNYYSARWTLYQVGHSNGLTYTSSRSFWYNWVSNHTLIIVCRLSWLSRYVFTLSAMQIFRWIKYNIIYHIISCCRLHKMRSASNTVEFVLIPRRGHWISKNVKITRSKELTSLCFVYTKHCIGVWTN